MSRKIYAMAIKKWGVAKQLEMAQEEFTEAALAVRKYTRNPNKETYLKMADELADLEIMKEQIIYMYPDIVNEIQKQKLFKLDRLEKRIGNNKFND